MYPPDWPRCPGCGDYALDGHLTCGRASCPEGAARDEQLARWRAAHPAPDAPPADDDP